MCVSETNIYLFRKSFLVSSKNKSVTKGEKNNRPGIDTVESKTDKRRRVCISQTERWKGLLDDSRNERKKAQKRPEV